MKVNGIYHDGTTIETAIEGVGPITGIAAINWATSVDSQKVVGAGQTHIGRTPGIIQVDDASMDIYLSEYHNLLSKSGGDLKFLMNKVFDITVSYKVFGEPPVIIRLLDCRITGISNSHSYGDSSALTASLTLQVMGIDTVRPTWNTVNIPFGA